MFIASKRLLHSYQRHLGVGAILVEFECYYCPERGSSQQLDINAMIAIIIWQSHPPLGKSFVLCTLSLALHDHSIYEPLPSVDMLVVSSAVSTVSHHRCNRLRTEGSQYPSIVIILHEEILLWLLTKHSLIV